MIIILFFEEKKKELAISLLFMRLQKKGDLVHEVRKLSMSRCFKS